MRKRLETLWAIRPEAALTVVRLMSRDMVASATQPTLGNGNVQMLGTQWEASKPFTKGNGATKLAVIPIQGVLTNDGPAYYGSNYQTISDAVDKAVADDDVKRIVLAVDSPGGEVTGLPETAAVLAAAAKVKPISAIVEGAAASAAYWLTSQASDITLTPSGEVGSVGVRMMHIDISKMLKAEGYTVTELHSGEFKTEWSPYAPLTDEAKADMQSRLDANYGQFLSAVGSGRGRRLSVVARQTRFGGGRMLPAEEALKHGLVDKLQSGRDFYRTISQSSTDSGATRGQARQALARLQLDGLKHSSTLSLG